MAGHRAQRRERQRQFGPRRAEAGARKLRADGTLDWIAPKGEDWRIVRMGWSLTGKTNHPATPEATGLEVRLIFPLTAVLAGGSASADTITLVLQGRNR